LLLFVCVAPWLGVCSCSKQGKLGLRSVSMTDIKSIGALNSFTLPHSDVTYLSDFRTSIQSPLTEIYQSVYAVHQESAMSEVARFVHNAGRAFHYLTMSSLQSAGPTGQAPGSQRQQEPPKTKRYGHNDQDTSVRY
jgi:hypothetical protein